MRQTPPDICIINVSERCALDCIHCYLDKTKAQRELSLADAEILLKQIGRLRPHYVGFEGDHPQLEDLIEIACSHDLEVTVGASGVYYNREFLDRISGKVKRLLFSVDGPTAEIHDKLRNCPGLFDKTIKLIEYARDRKYKVAALCTISNENVAYIEKLYFLMLHLSVDIISFIYTSPFGRAKNNALSVSPDIWKSTCNKIRHLRKNEPDITIAYEPVFCNNSFTVRNVCSIYRKQYMAINAVGEVFFCPLLMTDPVYALGNALKGKLDQIWYKSKKWKELEQLRTKMDICSECDTYATCGGGCFANVVKGNNVEKVLCYMYWDGLGI